MEVTHRKVSRGSVSGMDSIDVVGPYDSADPNTDSILKEIASEGKKDVVFNFRQTTYLTSPGIACIIKAVKKMKPVKGMVHIYGATQDMVELLELANLSEYLHIMKSTD